MSVFGSTNTFWTSDQFLDTHAEVSMVRFWHNCVTNGYLLERMADPA